MGVVFVSVSVAELSWMNTLQYMLAAGRPPTPTRPKSVTRIGVTLFGLPVLLALRRRGRRCRCCWRCRRGRPARPKDVTRISVAFSAFRPAPSTHQSHQQAPL
eukprot:12774117-Alexandrium_andersonii.AAC.1